jgi:hypothetical protein
MPHSLPMSPEKTTRLDLASTRYHLIKNPRNQDQIEMPMPTVQTREKGLHESKKQNEQPKINGQIAKIKNSTKTNKASRKASSKKKHQHSIIVQCPRHNRKPFPPLSPLFVFPSIHRTACDGLEKTGRRRERFKDLFSETRSFHQSIPSCSQSARRTKAIAIHPSIHAFIPAVSSSFFSLFVLSFCLRP